EVHALARSLGAFGGVGDGAIEQLGDQRGRGLAREAQLIERDGGVLAADQIADHPRLADGNTLKFSVCSSFHNRFPSFDRARVAWFVGRDCPAPSRKAADLARHLGPLKEGSSVYPWWGSASWHRRRLSCPLRGRGRCAWARTRRACARPCSP